MSLARAPGLYRSEATPDVGVSCTMQRFLAVGMVGEMSGLKPDSHPSVGDGLSLPGDRVFSTGMRSTCDSAVSRTVTSGSKRFFVTTVTFATGSVLNSTRP